LTGAVHLILDLGHRTLITGGLYLQLNLLLYVPDTILRQQSLALVLLKDGQNQSISMPQYNVFENQNQDLQPMLEDLVDDPCKSIFYQFLETTAHELGRHHALGTSG
jgi:hypothetical protein